MFPGIRCERYLLPLHCTYRYKPITLWRSEFSFPISCVEFAAESLSPLYIYLTQLTRTGPPKTPSTHFGYAPVIHYRPSGTVETTYNCALGIYLCSAILEQSAVVCWPRITSIFGFTPADLQQVVAEHKAPAAQIMRMTRSCGEV
ncbi:hypothetical protein J6590_061462 [Homalodisca vitripennis]|nr:hypothetical protein J6590_061462 [Homalodisca vitripennis]